MKNISINRTVIVGFFILFGTAILVAGVFTIGSQQRTFQKTVPIKVIFEDVEGLQPGNNVWLSGVKIGTVKKMQFHGNSQVEVTMAVEKDAIIHIRKNARAKISSDGFIGNRIVVIYGGTPAQPAVGSGDYLVSESGITTDDILGTLQDNNKNLLEITGNLKEVTEKIRDGKGTLGNLVNSSSVANNLNNTLQHIKNASARTEETIGLLKDFAEGLSKEGGLAHELVNDTTVFTSIKQTTTRLRQVADTLSVFSDNIKNASGALGRNDNAAGTILNDKQIAEDLKRITENLRYGSEKLDEDLIALQHNFLLKGYFKKQEKEKNKQPAAKDTLPH